MTGLRESAQVRVIQASSDSPPVDLYLGENGLAYGLAFGTRTSYVPVSEGNYMLHADAAGTRQVLGAAGSVVAAGHQYTAIVGDALGSLQLTLLADQTRPAPAGGASLRLVDQASRSGPLDVYLVPSRSSLHGDAWVSGMNFGAVEEYRNVPAGSYSVAVLPAGAAPGAGSGSLFTSPQMKLGAGSVKTIVLLDRVVTEHFDRSAHSLVQAIVNDEVGNSGTN